MEGVLLAPMRARCFGSFRISSNEDMCKVELNDFVK